MVYIGIDLGTTYSCVAIIENGACKIIFDGEGKNFLPSIVSFGDEETLVGNLALNYHDLSSVLYDSKRLLGWKFMHNLPIAENRLLWTFNLDTRKDKVGYVLNKGKPNERFVTPEEVSAEILKKIKTTAESYIGSQVTGAVITIPANFQESQIAATKRAVEMAGLELKLLIEEPIAAAVAYNAERKLDDSMIMIFDFGGGTLDISICEIKNGKVTIRAVKGDEHLGGQDFDSIIMNHVYAEYMQLSNNDIFATNRLVKRLRNECRRAKEALSFTASTVNIHLDIDIGPDLDVNLTKAKFNELCNGLFTRAINLIDQALRMAQLHENDISHVILVGGSTRIPAVKELLERKFGRDKLKCKINPDEAIVFGAANLADAIEKRKKIPLINNTMAELSWNNNDLQIGGDNSHKILFYLYYRNDEIYEGRICLFNVYTCSVEKIAKFHTWYRSDEIATTQNKIFGIRNNKSLEIYDLNTRQVSRGPDPPEWREDASIACFKDKFYYLGGKDLKRQWGNTNRVDVLIDGKWETGPAFPHPTRCARTITCDESLYVIDKWYSDQIYRLSDNEQEWIEIGEILEQRELFGAASLNGKIYITGGYYDGDILKSCLCFDPSIPVYNKIFRIADMNYTRKNNSLIVANGKLYVIGGFQTPFCENFCNSIEEYDPQANKWCEVGKINPDEILFYLHYLNNNNNNNNNKDEGKICLFNSSTYSVEDITKFHNYYEPYEVATTQDKIFGIRNNQSLEIYDLNTGQVSRGPDPPEWRDDASIACFKDKLYYLGGKDPKTKENTNRVDVLIGGKWKIGLTFPLRISCAQTIICDGILYVIYGLHSKMIYRLSYDERKWTEIGEIEEERWDYAVASLNEKFYITGGYYGVNALKSCLCFDPSASINRRISRIADMDYGRLGHSLIVADRKLYAIGGYQDDSMRVLCNSIEEYDPQTNEWREVGQVNIK